MDRAENFDRGQLAYDLPPSFLRQRRNLLVASLILAYLSLSGATVADVHLPGLSISPKREGVLFVFLWLIWTYFLIRYWQYFELFRPKIIKSAFELKLAVLVESKVDRFIKSSEIESFNALTHSLMYYTGAFPAFLHAHKHSIPTFRVDWEYHRQAETGGDQKRRTEFKVSEFHSEVAEAERYSKARLPYVTDYYFPYLIALISCGFGMFIPWSGSPLWALLRILL